MTSVRWKEQRGEHAWVEDGTLGCCVREIKLMEIAESLQHGNTRDALPFPGTGRSLLSWELAQSLHPPALRVGGVGVGQETAFFSCMCTDNWRGLSICNKTQEAEQPVSH